MSGIFENIPDTIYAVGDIHGDYEVLKHVLTDLSKVAIFKNGVFEWIGGGSYIVFCGDLIDRMRIWDNFLIDNKVVDDEDNDKNIIKTLIELDKQAKKKNGRVIIILGNHELIWNFNYDNESRFRFVSPKGQTDNREKIWTPGSDWAKEVSESTFSCVKIGNVVLVHGGFCREAFQNNDYLKDGIPIDKINRLVKKYLNTKQEDYELTFTDSEKKQMNILLSRENNNPFECRYFGQEDFKDRCYMNDVIDDKSMFEYLEIQDKGVMVIAHSPQLSKGINSICNGQVWRVDVAMSRAFDIHYDFFYNYIIEQIQTKPQNSLNNIRNKLKEIMSTFSDRRMAILKINKKDGYYLSNEVITENKLASDYVSEKKLKKTSSLLCNESIKKIIELLKENKDINTNVRDSVIEVLRKTRRDLTFKRLYDKYKRKYLKLQQKEMKKSAWKKIR